MKKNLLTLALLLMAGVLGVAAQTLTAGYYTIKNTGYERYMCEDFSAGTVSTAASYDASDYEKVWQVANVSGGITLQNVYTGHYANSISGNSQVFPMGTTAATFSMTEKEGGYLLQSGNIMHCAASQGYQVVGWNDSTNPYSIWSFESVSLTDAEVETIRQSYAGVDVLKNNVSTYNTTLLTFFTDASCSQLNSTYASYTDANLKSAMATAGLPEALQNIAVKVKNQWVDEKVGDEEDGALVKSFRVRDYKCYSEATYWCNTLRAEQMSDMNNPTGICANTKDLICVFVGGTVPSGCQLRLLGVTGNGLGNQNSGVALSQGLNVIQASADNQQFYIMYTTSNRTATLSDISKLKIHIEGGSVLGYVDAETTMAGAEQTETAKATAVNALYKKVLDRANAVCEAKGFATTAVNLMVVGRNGLFMFPVDTYNQIWKTTPYNSGYTTDYYIYNSINWYDNVLDWEWGLTGFMKRVHDGEALLTRENVSGGQDIYPTHCNNKALTLQGEPGSNPYATWQRTSMPGVGGVESSYNAERADFDNWCVGHESGHDNQALINLPSSTESSNNLFSNVVCYLTGYRMSRGEPVSTTNRDYVNGTQFALRDIGSTHRMYYQMYLYYHMAKNKTDFYPTLFCALRQNPLNLDEGTCFTEFYKKCCDAAGQDLTDYFTVWGFLQPFENTVFGDYTTRTLTLTQSQVDAAIAYVKAKNYPVNEQILFIDDRIETSYRTDIWAPDETTAKPNQGYNVGQCGTTGSVNSFTSEAKTVTTGDYVYAINDGVLTLTGTTGGAGVIIRDADGKIIAYGNGNSIAVPSSVGDPSQITVSSVSTDGTATAAVKDVATAGTEAQQGEALSALIASAKAILDAEDETGTKVGYYKSEYLIDLKEIYEDARSAYAAGLTSRYGTLITTLNQEISSIKSNDDLTIKLVPGNAYSIRNVNNPTLYASVDSETDVLTTSTTVGDTEKWKFIDDGNGYYYIQNVGTSKYIGYMKQSTAMKCNAENTEGLATQTSDGVAYTHIVGNLGSGKFYLECIEAKPWRCWNVDGNNTSQLVGWHSGDQNSQFYITCVETSEEGEANSELTSNLSKATSLLNQVTSSWETKSALALQTEAYNIPYYVSTNAQEPTEGAIANLVDGNTATYFHSTWSTSEINEDHYIKVNTLSGNEIDQFILNFTNRKHSTAANSGNDSPTTIVISATNDEEAGYTTIRTLSNDNTPSDNLPTATGSQSSYTSPVIGTKGQKYQYWKFTVTETNLDRKKNGHCYFALGELSMSLQAPEAVYTLKDAYKGSGDATITALENLIVEMNAAQTALASGTTAEKTAANTALETKYNALLSAIESADKSTYLTELNTYITNTAALINGSNGVATGTYTYETGDVPLVDLQTTNENGAYYVSTNHQETKEGPIANLIDGKTNNFFHTTWSEKTTDKHYLQVDLGDGNQIDLFNFSFTSRANGANCPNDITISGSTNGTDFTDIVQLTTSTTPALPETTSSTTSAVNFASTTLGTADTKYRYFRYTVNSTGSGNGNTNTNATYYFFSLAEFNMQAVSAGAKFNGTRKALYEGISDGVIVNAADALATAQTLVADNTATASQLKLMLAQLKAAYSTLNAAKQTIDNEATAAERAQLKSDIEGFITDATTLIGTVMDESSLKEEYTSLNEAYTALTSAKTSGEAITTTGFDAATVEALTTAKTNLQNAITTLTTAKATADTNYATLKDTRKGEINTLVTDATTLLSTLSGSALYTNLGTTALTTAKTEASGIIEDANFSAAKASELTTKRDNLQTAYDALNAQKDILNALVPETGSDVTNTTVTAESVPQLSATTLPIINGHFAIMSVSKYMSFKFYNGSGTTSSALTPAYLLDLESNGNAGEYYLKSTDGNYFCCANATPSAGKEVTKGTTNKQAFTLSTGTSADVSNNFSSYSDRWVKFTNVANTAIWLNCQENGTGIYNSGTGAYTAFAAFGPYYIATINYKDGENVLSTVQKVVTANTTLTAEAPANYELSQGQSSSLVVSCTDATFDVACTLSGHTVSGSITDGTNAVEGATVKLGTKEATTAADGSYAIPGVMDGTYTLKVVKDGKYAPTTLSVTVDGVDVTEQNLTYKYLIGFDPESKYSTRSAGGRYTKEVGFEGNMKSTGYVDQETSTNYVDLTAGEHFSYNNTGVSLTPSFKARMNAMRFYTYIDYNGDGDFSDEGELVSKLAAALAGQYEEKTYTTPAFTLGTTAGSYRIRFICDWNSETGCGDSSIPANGGCVIDAIIDITEFSYADYSSAISPALTAATNALNSVKPSRYSTLTTEKSNVETAKAALDVTEENYTADYAVKMTSRLSTLADAVAALNTAKSARDEVTVLPFEASTLEAPKYYYIHNKATTGQYVLARNDNYLGHGTNKTVSGNGVFVFIDANNEDENGEKRYYIYNVGAESYLKYTQNTAGKKIIQQVSENTDAATQWYILADNKTDYTAVDIMPGNVDLTAEIYQSWNVNGGYGELYTGLYNQNDAQSCWVPEAVTLTSEEVATLKTTFTHYYAKYYTENKGGIGYLTQTKGDEIDAMTSLSDVKAAFAALTESDIQKPTTGYYRIKNKATDWYAFSNVSLHASHALLSGSHSNTLDGIWYVTMDDQTMVSAVNVNGNPMEKSDGSVTGTFSAMNNVTLESDFANNWIPGTLYMGGAHGTNQNHFTLNNEAYDAATNPGIVGQYAPKDSKGSRWVFYPVAEADVQSLYENMLTNATLPVIIQNKRHNQYAQYVEESKASDAEDAATVLSKGTTIDVTGSFFLVTPGTGDYAQYYTIRVANDPTKYVYAINTNDANSNVGVKTIGTEGTVDDACYWTISDRSGATDGGKNIIPKGGSNGWNIRGSYGSYSHIGQWGSNDTDDNTWYIKSLSDMYVIPSEYIGESVGTYTKASNDVLRSAVIAANQAFNTTTYAALNTAKSNLAINMPQAGKAYKIHFQFLDKEAQQLYYDGTNDRVACNAASQISDDQYGLWVCYKSATDGKFYFRNGKGKYLVWCDSGDGNKSVSLKGYTDTYTAAQNDWTVEKADANANGGSVSGLTDATLLGSYQMKATGKNSSVYYLNARWEGETTNSAFISGNANTKYYDANSGKPRSYVFRLEELGEAYVASISAAGYATLCLPFKAKAPEGVELYSGSYNSDRNTVTMVPADGATAGEGYIVKAQQGVYTFVPTQDAVTEPETNCLKGVLVATSLADLQSEDGNAYSVYGLSYDANRDPKVQFNLANGGTLGANKAVLRIAQASEVAQFISVIWGDEATSLTERKAESDSSVGSDGKYIENGQLVIVKNGIRYNAKGQVISCE